MPAATNLFRKAALDQLSSPEQLDQLIEVGSARTWIALLGLLSAVAATVVWGFAGRVATDVTGKGLLVRQGGIRNVASEGSGQVATLSVAAGQTIQQGAVVATLRQPGLEDQILAARGDIAALEDQRASLETLHRGGSSLELSSIEDRQKSIREDMHNLEAQAADLRTRISTDEGLLAKGLITRQELADARQRLAAIGVAEQDRQSSLAQLNSDRFRTQSESTPEAVQISGRLEAARLRLQALRHELELESTVRTPYGGRVIEVKTQPGAIVAAGESLLSLQAENGPMQALVYVSAGEAKQIQPGMAAQISPTQYRREEYGFILGTVSAVSSYPATPAALMERLANPSLMTSLMANGPVFEVQIALTPDPGTPSGFRWSSRHGIDVALTPGTIVTSDVVVREQSPASLIVPYTRQKLGLR
jgi:HlyD family secretion protein